ncbi:MAG: ComEC/Rec2 family competence protein [Verrucomicrobia bacterium]|nr:ComEC/Rec2 family competence protein [Verrucomicrobiota bacterium]
MKRPLLAVALPFVAGILVGNVCPIPLPVLWATALALPGLALGNARHGSALIWLGLFFCGWLGITLHTTVLSPRDLRSVIRDSVHLATIRGRLCETPVLRSMERGSNVVWRSVAEVEVVELETESGRRPVCGRVQVNTPGVLDPEYFGGRSVFVEGVLRRPPGPEVAGLFDYRGHLDLQGIHYQLTADSGTDWRLDPADSGATRRPLSDRFMSWARATLAKGLDENEPEVRSLWAMALGWRSAVTDEVSEPLKRSGTLHVFAISGLHVALIAAILVQLLRVIRVPRAISGIVLIPGLWCYAMVTGWQTSAVRATIMMSVIIAGWALNRPSDLLNSLAGAGLIVLMWDPLQLFQASFQLSFAVVLSIALVGPVLQALRLRLLEPDPFLPEELRPWWRRWMDPPIHHVSNLLAISIAAWAGSLPLIATYFHLVTPVSLLANLVIVPLAGLALMASLGSLLCGDLVPSITVLFNHSAWLWMHLILQGSQWAASLPGACFHVRAPSLVQIGVYVVLLGSVASGWAFDRNRRCLRVSVLLFILMAGIGDWIRDRALVRLTVFPLGGGAIHVEGGWVAEDLMVDCGDSISADRVLTSFLQSRGVNRIRRLLLTHGDTGHVGGFEVLKERFGFSGIDVSPVKFRSAPYRRIVEEAGCEPGLLRYLSRGDTAAGWRVLHPGAEDNFSRADDGVLVLRGDLYGLRMLLISDLGRIGQRRLLETEAELRADILVAGLPPVDEALLDPLLEVVRPRLVIVASGEVPASNRPSRELRERLAESDAPVLYTHETGGITVRIRPDGWEAIAPSGLLAFGDLPGVGRGERRRRSVSGF